MQIKRKHLTWAAGAAGIGALLIFAFRPKPVEIEWAPVRRGSLRVLTEGEAQTRMRAKYVITAPVSGRVERLHLTAGDSVRAGAVVTRIAPLPLDPLALEQAQARYSAAEALRREAELRISQARVAATQATRDADRARAVEAAGGLSLQQRESAEVVASGRAEELLAAQSRLGVAESEVRAAAAVLAANRAGAPAVLVRSPVRGRVMRIPEISERVTMAGTPLLELGDAADLEIVADLLSADAVRIPDGAVVELEGWGGDSVIRARVRLVEPVATTRVSALGVDEQRVNVIIEPPRNLAALGDGYRLTARIVLWEGIEVLSVPASAVFKDGDAWRVFVVDGDRARMRGIEIGHRSDEAVEVRSGLTAGDRVVLFPTDRVHDGTRLRLR